MKEHLKPFYKPNYGTTEVGDYIPLMVHECGRNVIIGTRFVLMELFRQTAALQLSKHYISPVVEDSQHSLLSNINRRP